MREHLVFYDGECGLCDRCVDFLLKVDTSQKFVFASLQGEVAKRFFDEPPSLDTIIVIESYATAPEIYQYGQAILRICWLLGGLWSLIGLASFLPSFLYNWVYRLVAKNRDKMKPCRLVNRDPSRFLD